MTSRKWFVVAGVVLGAAWTLAGCAGSPLNVFDPPGSVESQQGYLDGGGAIKDNLLAKVTDSRGKYKRNASKESDVKAIIGNNINAKDEASLKAFAIKFITEEALDSIALDNEEAWDSWKKNVAPKYIFKKYLKKILSRPLEIDMGERWFNGSGVIFATAGGKAMPQLLRDGGARTGSKEFTTFRIGAHPDTKDFFEIRASGTMVCYIDDANAKKHLTYLLNSDVLNNQDKFNDGQPQGFSVAFTVKYDVVREAGGWRIFDFSNTFEAPFGDVGDFPVPSPRN